jgi:PAS domain S-box-containing protein
MNNLFFWISVNIFILLGLSMNVHNDSYQPSNEDRLRALVTATSDVIYSLSADWEVMHALYGRGFLQSTTEPITGWKEVNVYAGDLATVNLAISKAIATKSLFELEHRVNRLNGTIGWTLSRAVPLLDPEGNIVEWFGTASDITLQKTIELERNELSKDLIDKNRALHINEENLVGTKDLLGGALDMLMRSETKLRYLIANAPVAIALLRGRGMIVETANQRVLEIWVKDESVLGKPLVEGLPELISQGFLELLDKVYTSGVAYVGKEEYAVLEGKEWFLSFVYQPIRNEDGVVDNILITATDVTELVQTRNKMEEAERAMRLAIEAANFGTWWIHTETWNLKSLTV